LSKKKDVFWKPRDILSLHGAEDRTDSLLKKEEKTKRRLDL
jgi:hypothetical protein